VVAISPNPSTFAGAKIGKKTENGKRKTENLKKSITFVETIQQT
jgi:hypothetical protein